MENSTAASYGNFVSAREPEFSTPSRPAAPCRSPLDPHDASAHPPIRRW
jgi:hypothetical protein